MPPRLRKGARPEDATSGGDPGEEVVVLQAVVDDATPELLAHAGRLLLAAGAVDVWSTPIVMKKGRLAVEVTVLAKPADESSLVELLFSESTTFGVRRVPVGRHVVQRDFVSVSLGGHTVPVKVGRRGGRVVTICARVRSRREGGGRHRPAFEGDHDRSRGGRRQAVGPVRGTESGLSGTNRRLRGRDVRGGYCIRAGRYYNGRSDRGPEERRRSRVKSDIEIAQEATLKPIIDVAAGLGLSADDIDLYGKYKAKIHLDVLDRLKDRPDGKLILCTAITPTPAGEGKTTINVGSLHGSGQDRQDGDHHAARALAGPVVRHQGRRGRRRLRPGRADGGHQPPLHR